jgi:hypothetical protein
VVSWRCKKQHLLGFLLSARQVSAYGPAPRLFPPMYAAVNIDWHPSRNSASFLCSKNSVAMNSTCVFAVRHLRAASLGPWTIVELTRSTYLLTASRRLWVILTNNAKLPLQSEDASFALGGPWFPLLRTCRLCHHCAGRALTRRRSIGPIGLRTLPYCSRCGPTTDCAAFTA